MKLFTLKKLIATALLCMGVFASNAEIPAGYYRSLNGKSNAELKTAIHNLLKDHTLVSSYNALPQYFAKTDVYNDGSNRWWDMYSNDVRYAPSFSGLNREHSFPKSWWGGGSDTPAYVDLNHLYPSEMKANTAKSNYPLGVVATASFDNGCSKVGSPTTGQGGGASKVFEPDDRYKGDLARAYFYMVCCYQNLTWKYTYMVQQGTYPTLTTWAINLLMKWHREDPPSEKEYLRNEEVYKVQNNRNPFIDYPELAEYIWGNKKDKPFYETNSDEPAGDPILITPVQGMTLDFGQVAIGKSTTARLLFRGENLTGSLSIALSTGDKAMFSIPTKSISTSKVNTPTGYDLEITYTPTAIGKHTTKLIVSDGGITGSRGIVFNAECCEMPTLQTPKALPATDIQEDSYVANWEIPAGDEIDYYIVTRTRLCNGVSSIEEIEAETNSLEIEDFAESTSESYYVQSVRLGERSQPSNVIFVEHAGVTGIEADMKLGTCNIPGGVRFVCSQVHHNVAIYDVAGRQIMTLPQVENDDEIMLPYGVYLISVPSQRQLLKVIVK